MATLEQVEAALRAADAAGNADDAKILANEYVRLRDQAKAAAMPDMSKLSSADLEAIVAGDVTKMSDAGLMHITGQNAEPKTVRAPRPDEIPEFRSAQEPGIMQRVRESLSPLIGPTDNQRLAQQARALAAGADGRPETADERGAIPAIAAAVAKAVAGPPIPFVEKKALTEPGSTLAGAAYGEQLGAPLGLYGRLGGAALGGATAFATDKYRQYIAGEGQPATPGEIVQAGVNAMNPTAAPTRSAAMNAIKAATLAGTQTVAADASRRVVDGESPMTTEDAASVAVLPAGIAAALGKFATPSTTGNAVRDRALDAVREAGYVVPESDSTIDKVLRGIAGPSNVKQAAIAKNQAITDSILREANRLAPDAELTEGAMKAIRDAAYQEGYTPVATAGTIRTDPQFKSDLAAITANGQGAARSFPQAVNDSVSSAITPLAVEQFDAGDALKMTRLLRDEAKQAFANGDAAMGRAKRAASQAIEDQIERGLTAQGASGAAMLNAFRQAREDMAVSHATEAAIRAGGGSAVASRIGAKFENGAPLTRGLDTVGLMANNFPRYSGEAARTPQPGVSKLQPALAVLLGAGVGAGTGNVPAALGASVLPYTADAVRAAVLSKPYQSLLNAKPLSQPTAAEITRIVRLALAQREKEKAEADMPALPVGAY